MGIFNFLKAAGKNILTRSELNKKSRNRSNSELKARKEGMLEGLIYNADLKIKDLDVELNGDKLTVYGETSIAEHRQKAVLILGNVAGISEVDNRISLTIEDPEEEQYEIYEVQSGDSLSKIAKRYYNDPLKYHIIFEANKHIIEDPNLIYPGQQIVLPKIKSTS